VELFRFTHQFGAAVKTDARTFGDVHKSRSFLPLLPYQVPILAQHHVLKHRHHVPHTHHTHTRPYQVPILAHHHVLKHRHHVPHTRPTHTSHTHTHTHVPTRYLYWHTTMFSNTDITSHTHTHTHTHTTFRLSRPYRHVSLPNWKFCGNNEVQFRVQVGRDRVRHVAI